MSGRIHLDANVVLRFLRNDDPRHSPAAAKLFQKAADGKAELLVSAVTIHEIFYAFTTSYKLSRPETAKKLLPFVSTGVVRFEHQASLLDALRRVESENVDFGDAYLAATAAHSREKVASFDKDFENFKDLQLYDFES
ncbi:MAG TPA: PIN domain-containing protein [Verrucomicrobiae bacterium]|nr:PIN domain-containing protein [Verrucomicrobiae bacterium]